MKKLLLAACLFAFAAPSVHAENLIEKGMKDNVKKECHFNYQGDIVQGFGKLLQREHNFCEQPEHNKRGHCVYALKHKCADWKAISNENSQPAAPAS